MEDIKIETVHKYTVYIHPFLTYDQFIDIQKVWTKDIKINPEKVDPQGKPEKPKMDSVNMNLIYEANTLTVSFLVAKIIDPKGQEVIRKNGSLPIPAVDGSEVMQEVQRISKEASDSFEGKKK